MPQKNDGVRLYNVMFPIYMLFLFIPALWVAILPFNLAFDSLVLVLAMRHWHMAEKMTVWKKCILRVWLFGFAADIAGAALITGIVFAMGRFTEVNYYAQPLAEVLAALPGVVLAGWLIYLLDKKWAFGKAALDAVQRHKLALALAVFTAPYTMFIPTRLLYGY